MLECWPTTVRKAIYGHRRRRYPVRSVLPHDPGSKQLNVNDEICRRSLNFVRSCIRHASAFVQFTASRVQSDSLAGQRTRSDDNTITNCMLSRSAQSHLRPRLARLSISFHLCCSLGAWYSVLFVRGKDCAAFHKSLETLPLCIYANELLSTTADELSDNHEGTLRRLVDYYAMTVTNTSP